MSENVKWSCRTLTGPGSAYFNLCLDETIRSVWSFLLTGLQFILVIFIQLISKLFQPTWTGLNWDNWKFKSFDIISHASLFLSFSVFVSTYKKTLNSLFIVGLVSSPLFICNQWEIINLAGKVGSMSCKKRRRMVAGVVQIFATQDCSDKSYQPPSAAKKNINCSFQPSLERWCQPWQLSSLCPDETKTPNNFSSDLSKFI